MKAKECTVIYLITVLVSVLASTLVSLDNFLDVTNLQDRIETRHGISVHTINSLVGCAALCLANGNCWSLFYNFVTRICRLNQSPFLAIGDTTSQSDFHHYSREFCAGDVPTILHTSQVISFKNGIPAITFACTSNAVYISGNGMMTCDLGTLQWTTATVVCKDLAPYQAKGYTTLCGIESILKFVGSKVNFDAAKTACTKDGGHLARPRTTIRWECLKDHAFAQSLGTHVWMDITDRDQEGTLKFSDNSLVPLPHHWLPGEPLAATQDSVDCVGVWPNQKQWDDLPCGNVAHYICEIHFV